MRMIVNLSGVSALVSLTILVVIYNKYIFKTASLHLDKLFAMKLFATKSLISS